MKTGRIQKNTSLSTRALLVSVNISQWAGRKLDKRATETANAAHKAESGAGNYTKRLLPAAMELEKVSTIASQARKFYYDQTLPWLADGTRIISGKNYLNFQSEMRKMRSAFETAVREFEYAYPRLKSEAKNKLGDLFDESEYPENISEKFAINVDFFPMPDSKDFRVAIAESERKAFETKLKAVENAAMVDASNRLYSLIKAATERLNAPKAIFRDSLIENIGEIAALIPALNISDSPELDRIASEAKTLIDSVDAKKVRTSSKVRNDTRKALSDIESKMGAFMGALK